MKIVSLPHVSPDENGILYDATINQERIEKFLKTAFFGIIEIIIVFIAYTSAQKYFGFPAYVSIERFLLLYLVIRCGLVLMSEHTVRIVVTEDELRYYEPKKKGRTQKIVVIPRKNIVKIAADLHILESIYITYMQDTEKKELHIYAHAKGEVSKLREISILLQKK